MFLFPLFFFVLLGSVYGGEDLRRAGVRWRRSSGRDDRLRRATTAFAGLAIAAS